MRAPHGMRAADRRIVLALRYIADEELQVWLGAADVVVLDDRLDVVRTLVAGAEVHAA